MRFEKEKHRLHRYGLGVTVEDMWWADEVHDWVSEEESGNYNTSNYRECKTIRAFRRMLRKHPQIKNKARWVNEYAGYDAWV